MTPLHHVMSSCGKTNGKMPNHQTKYCAVQTCKQQ